MMKSHVRFFCGALLLCATAAQAQINTHVLENSLLRVELTADIGGRVLAVHLRDHDNLLKVGAAIKQQPNPVVSVEADNIDYLGHETWVGPQNAWWTQQDLNPKRKAAKAWWPPDPYLVVANNQVVEKSSRHMVMQTPASPVSGVELRKTFALDERENIVNLKIEGKNIREEAVSWDLWFNTRVHQDTQVYVPVASDADVRVQDFVTDGYASPTYTLKEGVLVLELRAPPEGKTSRHGKLFIQPSEGWLAGFRAGQLLLIRFPLQPLKNIHPEQGQVELYHHYRPKNSEAGVLEMEVHSAYRTLAPGESMTATEQWILLPYTGPDTHEARVIFLREQLDRLTSG